MGKPSPGDKVVVKTNDDEFVGVVLPRPSRSDKDYITLKLDNGYNIGLSQKDIKEMKVCEKHTYSNPRKTVKQKTTNSKPTASIISTGGTISSRIDYRTGGVNASFTADDLLGFAPELEDIANIKAIPLMNVMSEDMTPHLWLDIATSISKELNSGVDGVVVTHGTDTMHYTAAALSFLLPNLGKPVVLTGAQRSTDRGSSDTFLNLICSTILATKDYAGVYLVMHGSLNDEYCIAHNGTRVRKMHTTRRDAFQSINAKPVARVFPDGRIQEVGGPSQRRTNEKTKPSLKIEEKVALIRVYPGMDPEIIDFYINKGYKGLVFEGTALGHVPTSIPKTSIIPKIEEASKKGIIMVMTTQCLFGRVHPLVYSNLREVSSRGVIYCQDMLPETAYTKLMWVLGQTRNQEDVEKQMLKNISGEISDKTDIEEEFLNTPQK
ncbi:MAG: Glu-tRNA(Gln) amidotransferase subunit GatD [Methanobacteriota archaeon]